LYTPEDNLRRYQERAEAALNRCLPSPTESPVTLHEAMRYVTLGGKRVRAALVYATGEALGTDLDSLDAPACAVEMIHAYSLVHDDLPCMDNDELRRGKPTCHVAYGEATALLVGDALQTLAFETLANAAGLDTERRLAMVATLARAAGSHGMAGGQAIDLASVGLTLDDEELRDMHARKTGALIAASVKLGVLAAGCRDTNMSTALDSYGRAIGLAFQIADDILDVEGATATLGKSAGKDAQAAKPTYVSVLGLDAARDQARALHAQALESLRLLGDNGQTLAALAGFIIERRQ
jgi:geranylgeranyl pyrophosphate synthase